MNTEPPAHLDEDARHAWTQIAPALAECRVLTALDLPKLEVLAIHVGLHRRLARRLAALDPDTQLESQSVTRLLRMLRAEAELLKGLAAGFGLDPADRARLHIEPPGEPGKWDEYFAFDAYQQRRTGK